MNSLAIVALGSSLRSWAEKLSKTEIQRQRLEEYAETIGRAAHYVTKLEDYVRAVEWLRSQWSASGSPTARACAKQLPTNSLPEAKP